MKFSIKALALTFLAALVLCGQPAAAVDPPGVLFVTNGNVGINTANPTTPFHLVGPDQVQFLFESSTLSSQYNFKINGQGNFVISRLGTSGFEMKVSKALDVEGPTVLVRGSVRATSFIQSSSRDLKHGLATLDGGEVLAKVADLPISTWSFKADSGSTRHIGPMAEDFHAAFGVGTDPRHIALGDATGVALAAIQGLNARLEEKDRQIEELLARVADLERRLVD